ncbi:hypothetical protein ZOSMA_69G00250 [Zostera marina]|uniref:COX assembly mitochondrial protein n=1 Tax=Zostera marina TaxID=29655 RepID=A0A0K9NRB8_ZOSMR|nr:hypothetical protein ZOSMA_69G00250 [Zostera marina]
MVRGQREGESKATVEVPSVCVQIHKALLECVRKVKDPIQKEAFCRHLNRKLAECVVSAACPDESEMVRAMCSSSGTLSKRKQCQEAQLRLSSCLSFQMSPRD